MAFKYAVYRLNRERTVLPNTTLVYDIQYVPRDDSFRTSKKGDCRSYLSSSFYQSHTIQYRSTHRSLIYSNNKKRQKGQNNCNAAPSSSSSLLNSFVCGWCAHVDPWVIDLVDCSFSCSDCHSQSKNPMTSTPTHPHTYGSFSKQERKPFVLSLSFSLSVCVCAA